jgi:hypothetical protein
VREEKIKKARLDSIPTLYVKKIPLRGILWGILELAHWGMHIWGDKTILFPDLGSL